VIIDTSAIVAILLGEPGAEALAAAMDRDERLMMSAASVLEASIVLLGRRGTAGTQELDSALDRLSIEIVAFDVVGAGLARDAYVRWGRGNHPAALNFGDCFAYALAKATGEPLLCTGNDFAHTDLELVQWNT
jgi:ribonuclease VapC